MRKRQIHILPKKGNEAHHIFPVSIFGKNKLTVNLSYREHFIAHRLLVKICEKRYGKRNNRYRKMLKALSFFMQRFVNNSKEYEISRMAGIESMSGANNPRFGKPNSGSDNPNFGKKFGPLSDSVKEMVGFKNSKNFIILFPGGSKLKIKNKNKFCREMFPDDAVNAQSSIGRIYGYNGYFAKPSGEVPVVHKKIHRAKTWVVYNYSGFFKFTENLKEFCKINFENWHSAENGMKNKIKNCGYRGYFAVRAEG